MKRTIIDRLVGYISPQAEFNRTRFKMANEAIRAYDAATTYNTSDWGSARKSSANAEIRAAQSTVRDRSRDLTRNSPYANKAKNVIVSNTVGPGIIPKIKGRNKTQEKILSAKWKQWGETSACDYEGKHNFYGLQSLALDSIVEGGEVLAKKNFVSGKAKLQLLEPDFINTSFSNNIDNVQGLWLDSNQQVVAYQMYKSHPGDYRAYNLDTIKVPADQIIHAFKVERIGQLRGMPWAYPVANALKDFADYQDATLLRQKVAACVTMVITENNGSSVTDPVKLREQREANAKLEPASIMYLNDGQTATLANPPGVDQYDPFARQTLRLIAAGYGISYESLTGDYSQVNFSSGRMGHLEMQRNIDMWRWKMLIPMFCEPAFQFFLQSLNLQGIDTAGVTVEWTCPAREMIDPTKEIEALKAEVRAGFKPLPVAIRELGRDPDADMQETAEFNQKLDDLKLVFDSDPRRVTAQGMNQPVSKSDSNNNGDQNSDNQKNDASQPSSQG